MKITLDSRLSSIDLPEGIAEIFEELPFSTIRDLFDRDVEFTEGLKFAGGKLAILDGIGRSGREKIRRHLIKLGFSDLDKMPGRLHQRFERQLSKLCRERKAPPDLPRMSF